VPSKVQPGEQTQLPPLSHVLPLLAQFTQFAPASPQVLSAVPSAAQLGVPVMHWVQQLPPTHLPPLQLVPSGRLLVPHEPPVQVGLWHVGALHTLHVVPSQPHAPTALPPWHALPSRHPRQQLPFQHLPPVQLLRFGSLTIPQLPALQVGS
jgi:hypothetical protein